MAILAGEFKKVVESQNDPLPQVPGTLSCWAGRRDDFPMLVLRLGLSKRTGETPKGHRLDRFCSFSSLPVQQGTLRLPAGPECLKNYFSFTLSLHPISPGWCIPLESWPNYA
jgi:hypothetical protein